MRIVSIDKHLLTTRGFELSAGAIMIRTELVDRNILRIWSTTRKSFQSQETFVLEKQDFPAIPVRKVESDGAISVSTAELAVTVHLDPFWIEIRDSSERKVLSTPPGETLEWNGDKAIQRFDLPAGVRVYGLGQGTSHSLDLRDQERRMWQQWDGFRYSGNGGIPFLFTSQGYGVLLNSPWASRFAIGKAQLAESSERAKPEGPWKADQPSGEDHPERFSILAEGGDMDLFIIHGPDYKRIIGGYSDLTGHCPLLPKWALGWIQCKNRYKNQEQLLEVGREFRRKHIPGDVLIIDWCWFERFGYLEWVSKDWPDPSGMARELKSTGFHLMQAQHPYMHQSSPHFEDFNSQGYLISWDPAEVPDKWPPDGIRHAVDFSHPEARKLWWKKIEPLFQQAIDGYWTDMGELETHPPGSSPLYLGCREKVHNIYSSLWNKALYDGQRSSSNRRVFCLSRTAYAGIQRYATALWSGDIDPSWEVFEDQVVVGQQVCLSGQPYWTTDIGGFQTTDFFEPELYLRWLQWGAFCPLFRTHGTRPENEPWSFGPEAEAIAVEHIRIRYRLMPYIYSLAYQTSQTGLSLMRAMMVEFPEDQEGASRNHQFMFGPSVLVAPVTKKGMRKKDVWLPEGIWYSYWDNRKHAGPNEISELAPLWKIPLFVRGGSIIPTGPEVLHTGMNLLDPLTLHIYPGKDSRFTLYEDDGVTYDYEREAHALTDITYEERNRKIEIAPARGGYPGFPARRSIKVIYHDFDCPQKMKINGDYLDAGSWHYTSASRRLEVQLPERLTSEQIVLEMEGTDGKVRSSGLATNPVLFSGYDLESVDSPFGFFLRIYLDNTVGKKQLQGEISIQTPLGWNCTVVDGTDFNIPSGEMKIARFQLTPEGGSFTANGMASAVVKSSEGEEKRDIQLGSGWAGWWTIAGPYREDGAEGFNKVYSPEKDGQISEDHLESGVQRIRFRGFEYFGYVNLDKIFTPKDITQMVAAVPEYKLCYASCIAYSPEQRSSYLQLMGEDRFKVWINGQLIAVVDICVAKPIEYRVRLLKGKNLILIKCTQDAHREWNDRSWGFHFRFTDEKRRPVQDIVYSPE